MRSLLLFSLMCIATGVYAADPSLPHQHYHKDLEQRQALNLSPEEATHIRMEMHLFLAGVQMIVSSAATNDMKSLAGAARELGLAAAHDVPAALRGKLPAEFKRLGHATHMGFDDLARDAESLGDAQHALRQLGQLMGNCVACHGTYRIELAAPAH